MKGTTAPAEGPMALVATLQCPHLTLPRAGIAFLRTCVPAPCPRPVAQEAAERPTQGSSRGGAQAHPGSPGGGVFCLLSEQTNSLEMGRRHRRAGLARFPLSKVFCSLFLSPSELRES